MDCPRSGLTYDGSTSDVQWVEISGCQYSITEGELLCWLHLYGDTLTKMNEMVHPDSDPESPMGNGTYIVKMENESGHVCTYFRNIPILPSQPLSFLFLEATRFVPQSIP